MAEHVRLLVCHDERVHTTARTIEEVPPFEGDPRDDVDLEYILATRHTYPSGTRHVGQLLIVDKQDWDNTEVRKQIIERIHEARGHTGFDKSFYDVKDNLNADAMTCWQRHGRVRICGDYRDSSKKLDAGTEKARRDLGIAPARLNRFLCDHCPVDSIVKSLANKEN